MSEQIIYKTCFGDAKILPLCFQPLTLIGQAKDLNHNARHGDHQAFSSH